MKAKQAYIVEIESLDHPGDKHFYLRDFDSMTYVKDASSLEELKVFADLNGYKVEDFKQLLWMNETT